MFASEGDALLDAYSATCLERVWRAEEFSNYMTQMLHPIDDDEFENGVQLARLRQAVAQREARPCWRATTSTSTASRTGRSAGRPGR